MATPATAASSAKKITLNIDGLTKLSLPDNQTALFEFDSKEKTEAFSKLVGVFGKIYTATSFFGH